MRIAVEMGERRACGVGKSGNMSSLPGCQKRWWADSDQNLPVIGRRIGADTSDGTSVNQGALESGVQLDLKDHRIQKSGLQLRLRQESANPLRRNS